MHVVIGLAHVGFCKDIGQIAYGLLHQHSTYVAELCETLFFIFPQAPLLTVQNDRRCRLREWFTSPVARTVCLQLIRQHRIVHLHPSPCCPTPTG